MDQNNIRKVFLLAFPLRGLIRFVPSTTDLLRDAGWSTRYGALCRRSSFVFLGPQAALRVVDTVRFDIEKQKFFGTCHGKQNDVILPAEGLADLLNNIKSKTENSTHSITFQQGF
jgi:hypothetical protein